MADNRIKIDKWININQLSKYTQGKNTGCIDWNSSIGNNIDFKYGDIEGTVIITKYDGKRVFFIKSIGLKDRRVFFLTINAGYDIEENHKF